jgi:3-oxoacyl-[acyl-carrier protein] reductase
MRTQARERGAALVTGASRGIGREIAVLLANRGHAVAIHYRNSAPDAREVVRRIRADGGKATHLQADLSEECESIALVTKAEQELGPLEILVNNAGGTRDRLVLSMKEADWDAMWRTNLTSARMLCRQALDSMRPRTYGRIVNLSSVVGVTGNAGQANYAAAKSAVLGLTRGLAILAAPYGITVNCVVPGYIHTDATSHLDAGQRAAWIDRIPMCRAAEPIEVAEVVTFLASEHAGYVTGQSIAVDGGLLARSES